MIVSKGTVLAHNDVYKNGIQLATSGTSRKRRSDGKKPREIPQQAGVIEQQSDVIRHSRSRQQIDVIRQQVDVLEQQAHVSWQQTGVIEQQAALRRFVIREGRKLPFRYDLGGEFSIANLLDGRFI